MRTRVHAHTPIYSVPSWPSTGLAANAALLRKLLNLQRSGQVNGLSDMVQMTEGMMCVSPCPNVVECVQTGVRCTDIDDVIIPQCWGGHYSCCQRVVPQQHTRGGHTGDAIPRTIHTIVNALRQTEKCTSTPVITCRMELTLFVSTMMPPKTLFPFKFAYTHCSTPFADSL